MELTAEKIRSLETALADTANQICCDCSMAVPSYVSINNGVFICSGCNEFHRRMDDDTSYTKHIQDIFTDREVRMVSLGGNRAMGNENSDIFEKYRNARSYREELLQKTIDVEINERTENFCFRWVSSWTSSLKHKCTEATVGSFWVITSALAVGGQKGFETLEWSALKVIRTLEWGAEMSSHVVDEYLTSHQKHKMKQKLKEKFKNKKKDSERERENKEETDEDLDVVVLELDDEDSFEVI